MALFVKIERVDATIEEFKKYNPNWIAPMHCIGTVASGKMALAFKDSYKQINAGDVLKLPY